MAVSKGSEGNLSLIILQGIAGGFFVYLACCEFMIKVFQRGNKNLDLSDKTSVYVIRMFNVLFFALGALVVIILGIIEPEHSH